MPPGLEQLLRPARSILRALDDVPRVVDAVIAVGDLARDLRRGVQPTAARLDGAVSDLAALRSDIAGLNRSLKPMSEDLDALRQAFEGANVQLERLREAMAPELRELRAPLLPLKSLEALDGHVEELAATLSARLGELSGALAPLERDLADVRDVVEPLHGASERLGRAADRLPGPGKRQR